MLQQTQVDTVLPYFKRWMSRDPDLQSLAKADEMAVKKLWEGLGYYSRCRKLLSAARAMVAEGYEKPPSSVEVLLKYPGIGPYTAGAVASIGHNVSVPAIDGNAERVTARLFDIEKPAGSAALRRFSEEKIMAMIPEGSARAFNQALMELGSLVCLPGKPLCPDCPWSELCLAKQRGVHLSRPLPKPRPAVEKIRAWGVLCSNGGRFLLRRRPDSGLWAGFWEIPWFPRKTDSTADVEDWGQGIGLANLTCVEVGTARFSFTRYRVTAWFVTCEAVVLPSLQQQIQKGEWGFHKLEDLHSLSLPAPSRKFLKLLE
jgi:A/G-specific adenine glycosylase